MKLKVLAAATLIGSLSFASQASPLPNAPHIQTSGSGVVEVEPDMATLVINVNTSAKKSVDAKKQADERVAEYFAFLERMGVEKKDINAANVSTSAEYNYSSKSGAPTLIGYRANRMVTVTLRELDKLNPILDGALEAQLNEISNIQLGVSDAETYKAQARAKAMENAAQQAQTLAEGFGVKLGPIYRISYQVSEPQNMPMPVYRAQGVMMDSSAKVGSTYHQETIKFNDSVSVVFEIQR